MPVKTIECHIAAVLMKRYLDGDNLPPELLADLEQHVKACDSCQAMLSQEKLSMEEVLDGVSEPEGVFAKLVSKATLKPAAAGAGAGATAYPTEALVGTARKNFQMQSSAPGMAAFKQPKVLVLSFALALVLIAMSTFLKDPTILLGQRAAANLPAGESSAAVADDGSEEGSGDEGETGSGSEGETEDGHEDESSSDEGDGSPSAESDHSSESETHESSVSKGGDDQGSDDSEKAQEPKRDGTDTPRPGTVVPGEKTINDGNVVIIGGDQPVKKSSETAGGAKSSQPAQNKPKSQPKSSGSTPPKKRSGGIKVYDENGKPIG